MTVDVSGQIAKLPGLSRQQLLDLWLKLYGRAAPPGIRRELMVPFLAYRTQEKAYGGLKPATRSQLLRIARALENATSTTEWLSKPKIKPGTRILRQWRGETHEIMVTESGYEYRAASYRSLSEIARRITGTRWSGPAFFGLKDKSSVRGHSDA
jgi:Protein of unknown function (DUF2924)